MESDVPPNEMAYKIREKIDFEQWVFEQKMEMIRVQSFGDLRTYENMLNSLVNALSPWWPDGFKAEWEEARKMAHTDPQNIIHRQRIEKKELLMATLIDEMGIGFTKKKKMSIKEGLRCLWTIFPPYPPSKEPSSKS